MSIVASEGGDVTGSIDESVRHAITKLAHLHFVTNEDAHRRVLAMGEDPRYVFNTGSLDVELAAHVSTTITSDQVNALGVGHDVDIEVGIRWKPNPQAANRTKLSSQTSPLLLRSIRAARPQ